jgi:PAS domain S-box-containing protein
MDSAQAADNGLVDDWPRHPLADDAALASTLATIKNDVATAIFALPGGSPLWWNAQGAALFDLPGAGIGAGDLAAALERACGSNKPWLERRRLVRAGRSSLATLVFCRAKLLDDGMALLVLANSIAPPLPSKDQVLPPRPLSDRKDLIAGGEIGGGAARDVLQAHSQTPGRRLTWQTDAEGHLLAGAGVSLSQALGRGAPMQPILLADLLQEARAVRGAITSGRPFAGLPVETVANPQGMSFIGALFGAPALNRDRRPTGFRGFLLVSRVKAAPAGDADRMFDAAKAGSQARADAPTKAESIQSGIGESTGGFTDSRSLVTADPVSVDLTPGHGALPPPREVEDDDAEPLHDEEGPLELPWLAIEPGKSGKSIAESAAEPVSAVSAEPTQTPARAVEGVRASAGVSATEKTTPRLVGAGRAEAVPRLPVGGEPSKRASNVIALRPPSVDSGRAKEEASGLSPAERDAFADIARALGASFASASAGSVAAPASGDWTRSTALPETTTVLSELGSRMREAGPSARMEPQSGTDRILADAARQGFTDASQADLTTIINRLPIAVAVQWQGKAVAVNATMLGLLDYVDLEDFNAHGGLEKLFVDPNNKAAPERAVAIRTRHGEVITVDARCQTVKWRGEAAALVSLRRSLASETKALEVTQRAELTSRDAQIAELRAILENASDGVVTVDEIGRILAMNHAAEALFSYGAGEIAGEAFTVLLEADGHAAAISWLREVAGGHGSVSFGEARETTGRDRHGHRIPLSMKLIRGPGNLHAVFSDLTDAKEQEIGLIEARATAERMTAQKSEFLAKVSHEIRTPLNSIVGFADLIAEERFGPLSNERYKEYLSDIRSSGTHIISLVNDLLDLSKIEAGRMELTFAEVNLNAEINTAVAFVQMDAARARVLMRQSLASGLPAIIADARSIKQIALNILANAVKFTDPGGQVIVSTAATKKGEIVFRVRDTGIGMTERQLAEAMEPFRQFATAHRPGGSGLGLSLTKALVKANHADLSISSNSGEGTLVEVVFPRERVIVS